MKKQLSFKHFTLETGKDCAFEYIVGGNTVRVDWPKFMLNDGQTGRPKNWDLADESTLYSGIKKYVFSGNLKNGVTLKMELRIAEDSPIIRFRYILSSGTERTMAGARGNGIEYLSYKYRKDSQMTEVRLSNYDSVIHGYCLCELPAFDYEDEIMGPMLVEEKDGFSVLSAYEHGSQYPDKFFAFSREGDRVLLKAFRGNYTEGRSICDRPYETVWLQFGAVAGNCDALAHAYREFQLLYASPNGESRKPYIFYNTWAYQERNKFWNGKTFLESLNQQRMEQEIDVAHHLGVDVFVIDTGWYSKTGDWEENKEKFPDGIKSLSDKLQAKGMKLGLWFNPTVAAKSSKALAGNRYALATRSGKELETFPVWETEESHLMCIVSDYWEYFADKLIDLAKNLGVRYFKWDAVDMYGCHDPNHLHGDKNNTYDELRDCYAFEVGRSMSKIVDKLCSVFPDAIVDVDVTESHRYFGLGFLASGKFFTMNNGPYYDFYDIKVPDDFWTNVFVMPGPARTWIMRRNLCYDKWIPSVLFMSHYLPDDPEQSQLLNLGSMILGQNGIWGDLLNISKEGQRLISEVTGVYKKVREDITRAYPYTAGQPGQAFEAHEKINSDNGCGVVVLFGNHGGEYSYHLHGKPAEQYTVFGPATVKNKGDCVKINAQFNKAGAAIVFFHG